MPHSAFVRVLLIATLTGVVSLWSSTARADSTGLDGLPVVPLAPGDTVVGTGALWGPVWGVPLYLSLYTRPVLPPSPTTNAYLALQPPTQPCAASPATDHPEALVVAPDVFVNGDDVGGTYEYQFATHPTLAPAPSVQACTWFAHSPHEVVPAVSQTLPLVNGEAGAAIWAPSGNPLMADWSITEWAPSAGFPLIETEAESNGCLYAPTGPFPPSNGQSGSGVICPNPPYSVSYTFNFTGANGTTEVPPGGGDTFTYTSAEAAMALPPVKHVGACVLSYDGWQTIAEAVYFIDQQGCTVDRIVSQGQPDGGQHYVIQTLIDGGQAIVAPVGTHVDLEVSGTGSPQGSPPPAVPGTGAAAIAPPGSDCSDLATFSPGFASKEKELFDLPSLASENLPIALTAGVSLGSVGICTRAVARVAAALVLSPQPGLRLGYAYTGTTGAGQGQSEYTFLPFSWQLQSGTGYSNPGPPQIEWGQASINTVPTPSFSFSKGESPETELTLMSVPIAQTTATLVNDGQAYMDAAIGPELDFSLKLNRKELQELVGAAVALGLPLRSASAYVEEELGDELEASFDRLAVQVISSSSSSIGGYEPDVANLDAEVSSDIASGEAEQQAAEAEEAETLETEEVAEESEALDSLLDATAAEAGAFIETVGPEELAVATRDTAHVVPIPAGFVGGRARLFASSKLTASPLKRLRPSQLRRARLPRAQIAGAVRAGLAPAVSARVGALVTTATVLKPAERVSVIAVGLVRGRTHAAQLVLFGPAFRATRLLQVRSGSAAATITLPRHLAAGRWMIAIEDISAVRAARSGSLGGQALVRMGIFSVHRRHPR